MRIQLLIAIALLVSSPPAAIALGPAKSDSVALVQEVYRKFTAVDPQGVNHEMTDTLTEQPKAVLERYFTPQLAALIVADQACVFRTEEECNLQFSPLWDSQDPAAVDVRFAPARVANEVAMTYRSPQRRGRKTEIRFRLQQTTAGLRIADVVYSVSTSLAELLARPAGR